MMDLQWWDYSDLKDSVQAAIADAQAVLSTDPHLLESMDIAGRTADDLAGRSAE